MPDDWTPDRLVSFALSLTTLDQLSPARVQELGEALAFLVQGQAATNARQADLIQRQADTIAYQAATIARLHDALQVLQAGVLLLGEEDHP